MVKESDLCNVLNTYMDREIAPLSIGKSPLEQLLFGFKMGVIKRKSGNLIHSYLENPVMKQLGIVDNDQVDVEVLYESLSEAMTKQGSIDLLGIRFTNADVNKLYTMLKEVSINEKVNQTNL